MYRYRLKECKENESLNSRKLEGTTLYKNQWIYRDRPLILESFHNLIEVEKGSDKTELEQKDISAVKQKRQEIRQRSIENIKKNPRKTAAEVATRIKIKEDKEPIEDIVEDTSVEIIEETKAEEKDVCRMKKSELIDYALELGFLNQELKGLTKSKLIELIEIDEEIDEQD